VGPGLAWTTADVQRVIDTSKAEKILRMKELDKPKDKK